MMDYLWSKFQQIRALFGRERAKKPPKRPHFMPVALPRKHLKIYNFGTTNGIKIKLTTIMYPHETFDLANNLGVTYWASQDMVKKPLKKCQKFCFLASFLGIFRTVNKIVLDIILCIALHHWSKFQKNVTAFGGSYGQKTTYKQPKIHFSGPAKTFANS